MTTEIFVDYESRSRLDIKRVGGYRYAEDPSSEIIITAIAYDDGPVRSITDPGEIAAEAHLLTDTLARGDAVLIAHNAPFESAMTSAAVGWPAGKYLDAAHLIDTMALAACNGLPRKLAPLAKAFGGEQKDDAGTRLINLFSKPNRKGGFNDETSHPEQWQEFVDYCVQDVETLRSVYRELQRLGWSAPTERGVWEASHRMNERGISIDLDLARPAVEAGGAVREQLMAEAIELTGLENPNSTQQLGRWLAENGLELEDMKADTVTEALTGDLAGDVRRALEIRQDLALSAATKFTAAVEATCSDGRARGTLAYFGAHTGRWAGRLIQPQNMPSASLSHKDAELPEKITDQAAAVLDVKLGLGATSHELKALVRAMIEGPFAQADYSAIEARVLAWLAGERWALDAFRAGRDLYVETGDRMGGLSRKEGKVAVLACIMEGEPVLTDRGLVPIEEVTTGHLVWDGIDWVEHEGLVFRGEREVIEYDGLRATPDHLVWVAGEKDPVHFGVAASSGLRLAKTGEGREAVRLGEGAERRGSVRPPEREGPVHADGVRRMRERPVDSMGESDRGENFGMQGVLPPGEVPRRADRTVQEADSGEATVYEPEGSRVQALRGEGNRVPVRFGDGSGDLGSPEPRGLHDRGAGPGGQRRALRAGELEVVDARGERGEPSEHEAVGVGSEVLAVRAAHRSPETVRGEDSGGDHSRGSRGGTEPAEELARDLGTARVYDLRNAGPRNRFTASNALVHNCGYQGSVGAMMRMGGSRLGDEDHLLGLVRQWRAANENIVQFWYTFDDAFRHGGWVGNHVEVEADGRDRHVILPSGRTLSYHNVRGRMKTNQFGKRVQEIVFSDPTKNGATVGTYGGKLTENITQAVARDLMAEAIVEMDRRSLPVVSTIHDEVLVEGPQHLPEILDIMRTAPEWADGLPLWAEGVVMPRYMKD